MVEGKLENMKKILGIKDQIGVAQELDRVSFGNRSRDSDRFKRTEGNFFQTQSLFSN